MKRRFVYECRDQYGFYVFGVYYQGQKMGHAYVPPGTFWGQP